MKVSNICLVVLLFLAIMASPFGISITAGANEEQKPIKPLPLPITDPSKAVPFSKPLYNTCNPKSVIFSPEHIYGANGTRFGRGAKDTGINIPVESKGDIGNPEEGHRFWGTQIACLWGTNYVFAYHKFYPTLQALPPVGYLGRETALYGPTMMCPTYCPLEVVSRYQWSNGQFIKSIAVYDHSAWNPETQTYGMFVYNLPSDYVDDYLDQGSYYVAEILKYPDYQGNWWALIWNFDTGQWENMVGPISGGGPQGYGWDVWEEWNFDEQNWPGLQSKRFEIEELRIRFFGEPTDHLVDQYYAVSVNELPGPYYRYWVNNYYHWYLDGFNTAPVLSGGVVNPQTGYINTQFTYSVTYTDYDNDPPDYVCVNIDGTPYAMTARAGEDGIYSNGEIYDYTCSGLARFVQHTYQFSASDYGNSATGDTVLHYGPTINNSPPSVTSVTISPDPAYTNDTLTATPSGWSDLEGDPEGYQWQWQKWNGSSWQDIQGAVNNTLDGSYFIKGDQIKIIATPYDGYDTGNPVYDTIAISNSIPTAPQVNITPEQPGDNDDLVCNITTPSTDADNDSITYYYQWFKNDVLQESLNTNTVLSSYTSLGEVWKCVVTPNDSYENGPSAQDEVTIVSQPNFKVILQGDERPTTPSGFNVPLTVKLYDTSVNLNEYNITLKPGECVTIEGVQYCYIAPLYEFTTADDEIEIYSIDYPNKIIHFSVLWGGVVGTYKLTLSSPHNLINLRNGVTINSSQPEIDMCTLIEGNPNEDEQIAIGDYTMLLADYLATPSDVNKWNNGRCDLDRDGQVRGIDFSLLSMNYTMTSPQIITDGKLGGESGGKDSYGTVNLSLQSSASEVYVDDQFSVSINVDADSQDLVSIDAFLNFNPDYLEVVSVTPGETLTSTLCNQYDHDEGTIDLCLGTSVTGSPVNGSFTMGTIVFQAKAATSSTAITFNPDIPRKTDVAYQGESLLGTATGTEVTIWGLPTVRATLQGSSRPYPAGFQVPLTLRLYDEELELDENNIMTAEWLYEYTTEDDEIDIFEINQSTKTIRFRVLWDCPDGVYHVTLWDPHVPHSPPYAHTLINLRNGVEIDPSQEEIDMSTLQEGNPNGDVEIGSGDYTIVLNDYLSYPGHANWNDGRSDFNHTSQVNGSDLSLLLMNYGEYSPVVVGGGKLGGEETFMKVDMSIVKSEDAKEISASSTFTATIEVACKEQKVDAIDAFLAFDPECLEVVSVKPGDALSTVLANRIDNAKGTITLSMGRDPKADSASGSFKLGTIEFKAKKEAKETRIAFEQKPPRKTDVAYHGESLLGTATDLILEVKP